MKITVSDAHSRLEEFKKQSDVISIGCQECIQNRPPEFGNRPFYIFAHKRELQVDERVQMYNRDLNRGIIDPCYTRKYSEFIDVPTARIIWEPRLTKPKAQTNSMLFKAFPPGDNIEIKWIIPDPAMWDQYRKGNLTEDQVVVESIDLYQNNRVKLEAKEPGDLEDDQIDAIYREMSLNARQRKWAEHRGKLPLFI